MSNVQKVTIDPEIILDESSIEGMSDDLKGHLLTAITMKAEKEQCHWKEIEWAIEFTDGQPLIFVKRKS